MEGIDGGSRPRSVGFKRQVCFRTSASARRVRRQAALDAGIALVRSGVADAWSPRGAKSSIATHIAQA